MVRANTRELAVLGVKGCGCNETRRNDYENVLEFINEGKPIMKHKML